MDPIDRYTGSDQIGICQSGFKSFADSRHYHSDPDRIPKENFRLNRFKFDAEMLRGGGGEIKFWSVDHS